MVTFTPTSVPAGQIDVRAPEGVSLSTRSSADWDEGKSELTVDSGDAVYAFSSKVGTHTLEFEVGTFVTRAKMRVSTTPTAAYSVESVADVITLVPGGFGSMSVRVVDPFGNPVPRTTDDSGGLTVTTSGQVLLGGLQSQGTLLTDDSGVATATLIAGRSAGEGTVVVAPPVATRTPAWQKGYKRPYGFPVPVPSIEINVRVGEPRAPVASSIVITGARVEVSGKRAIEVLGDVVGLAPGTTLSPWVRLTGQSAFTKGKAIITPDDTGEFDWTRITGKVARVYVETADGSVRSNRITVS